MLITRIKLIFLSLMLVALAACGGRQAALEENQAVAPTTAPDVAKNTAAAIQWRASSAGSKTGGAQFEPRIMGERIYVSNHDGRIASFDLLTGNRELSIKLGESLVSGVAVNANNVIAVTTTGSVIALDTGDGAEKWRHEVKRSISAAPSVNDEQAVIRTIDGHIIGLNAVTGEQVWALERPVASLSVGLDAPSLLAGEGVISGFSSGRVLANNLYNGSIFWEKRAFRPTGKNEIERLIDIDAQPVLAGQAVLVGAYKGGIVAYRLRNGEEIWRNTKASTRKRMVVSDKVLAVTGPQSEVSLLDLASGETKWQQNQLKGHGLSAPIVMEDSLVVGSLAGVLYFFDLSSGDITSQLKIGKSPITALRKVDQGFIAYSANSGALSFISL